MHRIATVVVFLVLAASGGHAGAADPADQPAPPARAIPGITAPEAHPAACVDCHLAMPDSGLDARLSTILGRWLEAVDPAVLAKARGAMPAPGTLVGRHPEVPDALANIPAACVECHDSGAVSAPAFSRLIHLIHLTDADDNHFLTIFQGECTHCHKLDPASGSWSVPSGPESSTPVAVAATPGR